MASLNRPPACARLVHSLWSLFLLSLLHNRKKTTMAGGKGSKGKRGKKDQVEKRKRPPTPPSEDFSDTEFSEEQFSSEGE